MFEHAQWGRFGAENQAGVGAEGLFQRGELAQEAVQAWIYLVRFGVNAVGFNGGVFDDGGGFFLRGGEDRAGFSSARASMPAASARPAARVRSARTRRSSAMVLKVLSRWSLAFAGVQSRGRPASMP